MKGNVTKVTPSSVWFPISTVPGTMVAPAVTAYVYEVTHAVGVGVPCSGAPLEVELGASEGRPAEAGYAMPATTKTARAHTAKKTRSRARFI